MRSVGSWTPVCPNRIDERLAEAFATCYGVNLAEGTPGSGERWP